MQISINGALPNTCIRLQAETEAERDQIKRLKEQADFTRADVLPRDEHVLMIRLENKQVAPPVKDDALRRAYPLAQRRPNELGAVE